MVRKEDVDFYSGFSRKELQSLCKKYNLFANRSRLDMAESLASYFEKISMNSEVFGVSGNQCSSATTSRAPASRTWDVARDASGKELATTREACFQGAAGKKPGCILGDDTPYQERNGHGDSADAFPYMRKSSEKGPIANSKKDISLRTDSRLENRMREVDSGNKPSSSSFEFHVSLEEGISLSVDLNFNPSDWINSMRDKVDVCGSMRRRKSPNSDFGSNNARERKKQKCSGQDKDGHVRRESSISPARKDNTQLASDHHIDGERSLASSALEYCSRIKEGSDTCKEKSRIDLSIPDSSGSGQIIPSCVESDHHINGERSLASSAIEPCSSIKESSDICKKKLEIDLSVPVSSGSGQIVPSCVESYKKSFDLDCVNPPGKMLTSDTVMVAAEQNHPAGDLLFEIPEKPSSMESFQKIGNSSTVICPHGAGSELLYLEAEAYHSNPLCSPRKIGISSNISSTEVIVDRESTSYSESFKFLYNGGKNRLLLNTEDQEKSEALSEQVRSE